MANELNQLIANSLFRTNPSLRGIPFDPAGSGYDYETAINAGMGAGADQHWGSRVELNEAIAQSLGLPPGSGIMLKGATHPTWDKALAGEEQAGFNVTQGADGRYYSVPKRETALGRFPVRQPYASELDYFTKNPNVAGMATEDNSVIINPLNPNMGNAQQRSSVIRNEGVRLLINSIEQKPKFNITPEQKALFKGTAYENNDQKIRETIAARIFSGDPSSGKATEEQLKYVDFLNQQISQ